MKTELKTSNRYSFATLLIECGNVKIEEDIDISGKIPDDVLEQFITVSRDIASFNKIRDVDFIKMIYDNFLTDGEQEEFKDLINS